jgi:hypothetical protein
LSSAELGEEVNIVLSNYHATLTRQGWSLAEKKQRLNKQQDERKICDKYMHMTDDDFFEFYDDIAEGRIKLDQFELEIVQAERSLRK